MIQKDGLSQIITDAAKIIVLGDNFVGKTAIIEQFVKCEFSDFYCSTNQVKTYFPVIFTNTHFYDLRLVDCPKVDSFPLSSLHEWPRFIGYGLHSAHAIILVFDISLKSSFQFNKKLREEILQYQRENQHYFPLIVVANKFDLQVLSEEERQHRLRMTKINQQKNFQMINANNAIFNTLDFAASKASIPSSTTNNIAACAKRSFRSVKIDFMGSNSANAQGSPRMARVRIEEHRLASPK